MSRYSLINAVLLVGVLVLAAFSLLWGEHSFSFMQSLREWWAGQPTAGALILGGLRLPRVLLGIMVGGSLGLSGAVLQGYLRNPLADPGLLGVSGGAALGAVCVFYTGLVQYGLAILPLGGLAGALVAATLLVLLVGRGTALVLLLAGAALSSFTAALTALVLNLVPSPYAIFEIMRWLMGSLTDRTMLDVTLALPGVVVGGGLLFSAARALDALTLGEDVAQTMGFQVRGLTGVQLRIVIGTALAVGSCVAVAGAIGFVGLIVPHILRPVVGHRPSRLLVPAFLGGAVLLLGSDLVVRGAAAHKELQIGVVTALIGAPVFFYRVILFRKQGRL
ncbi:MAG: FecCD family ABC transporter permease [Acetobacter cibinongensis]